MNEQPNTPDMIAQAGELLARYMFGDQISDLGDGDIDRTVVIASAILAVAGEIRELRNVLADGLLAELVRTDADNAALIARCRHYEHIEVPE